MLRSQSITIAVIAVLGLLGFLWVVDPFSLNALGGIGGAATQRPHSDRRVMHVVLAQFTKDAAPDAIKEVCASMLALKEACVHPSTQKPYILSIKGGKDSSPEGFQNGATHGFVVEFASLEDRDYYINHDPAHKAFSKKAVPDPLEKVTVVDFTPGEL